MKPSDAFPRLKVSVHRSPRRPASPIPVPIIGFVLCLVAGFLSACAVTPPEPPEPPVTLPDAWTAYAAGDDSTGEAGREGLHDDVDENPTGPDGDSRDHTGEPAGTEPPITEITETWWRDFRDAGLDALVVEALAANPSLRESEARVRAALAQARVAGADLYPDVSLGLDAGRSASYVGLTLPGASPVYRGSRFGASLNLGWEADLWGRIRAGEEAALADVESRRVLYEGARLSLAAQIAKTWFSAVESVRQVEIAAANRTSAEQLAERIRERFETGTRQALDLKLAETEVASARAALSSRRRALDGVVRQLEILAGRYPAAALEPTATLPPRPGPVPVGVPAMLLSRRPDLAAAELALAAAGYRTQEAEAGLYPRIALTASGGLTSDEVGDLLSGDFDVWSLAGNLTAPLFQGGRLRAGVALREAERDERQAAFAGSVLNALAEVEIALAAERELAREVRHLEDLAEDAQAGLDLSEERYLAGLADILSVLEARQRHFSAQREVQRARRESLTNRVDLYVALGGGFRRPGDEDDGEGDLTAATTRNR